MIKAGKNPPSDIFVVIEIPKGNTMKYELDSKTGIIFVDRKLYASMLYPGNYGFIPQTKAEDGDTVDVLLLFDEPLIPLCVIDCRPIGVLLAEDQSGTDSKVIAVPVSKIDPSYDHIQDITDVDKSTLACINHFFEHHKDLEEDKYVKILGWQGREAAMKIIQDAIDRNG